MVGEPLERHVAVARDTCVHAFIGCLEIRSLYFLGKVDAESAKSLRRTAMEFRAHRTIPLEVRDEQAQYLK
jgi:hypothetical protein